MSDMESEPDLLQTQASDLRDQIPTANVGPSKLVFSDLLRGSYMWLVALLCLVVAIGVAWWSMPQQGIEIMIHFPDGHGLAPDDAVRFRGIDVGVVDEVKLNRELSGVDVHINLRPFAEPLAREGTRFWIVRPQLSLGGVSGLETAVGHKYIGLIPGDPDGEWQTVFDGLTNAPTDALESHGIEILLRGEKRNSVSAGSPVMYRGVEVGRVLSVGLSSDGLKVDARLRIFDKYTKLVTSETKFWANSGIDAAFSPISGLRLEMESLETIVQGGVSMLTVANGGKPITPGEDFVLHASPQEDWFEQAESVYATDVERRGALPMEVVWKQKSFLSRQSEKSETLIGTHYAEGGQQFALIPASALVPPEKAIEGTLQIGLAEQDDTRVDISPEMQTDSAIAKLALVAPAGFQFPKPFGPADMRVPPNVEACLAIRANGEFGDLRYLSQSFEASDISEEWTLIGFDGDRDVWHGAPILAESDGKLIGILLVGENETKIVPLDDGLVSAE